MPKNTFVLHTMFIAESINAIEHKFDVSFVVAGDSYREWCERPMSGDPLHATLEVSTVNQAAVIADALHLQGMPSDLTTSADWSTAVELPPFLPDENHRSYSDFYAA